MPKQKLFFLFFICIIGQGFAQNYQLQGLIKSKNEALPFASVLVKGHGTGCTSNAEGYYLLTLPAGTYEIGFHYLGCQKKTEKIVLNKNIHLNVELESEGIRLKEIEIEAGEDPSYPIIRKAMQKREYYLRQVEAYHCNTYIKGLQKIIDLPKNFDKVIKFFGGKGSDTNQLKGIVYLSESESRFYFKQPRQIHEEMYSSKVSGNSQSFSFNKLSDMLINFNQNLVDMPGLSDRPLISPIHQNAFLWYRYYLLDIDSSEHPNIFKIKIVPKRANEPCFKGVVYVQDSSFRISGVDVRLDKSNKINFVDTLYIKQVHTSVLSDSIWMPVNLNLSFDFKLFGVKGYGYFNAFIKDYTLNDDAPMQKNKNEVLRIGKEANDKDSSYWQQHRPMPLTHEEAEDYRLKDSLKKLTEGKAYQDSIDRLRNKFEWMNLVSGYTYTNTARKLKITVPGILNSAVQYNTVEGLNLSYQFDLEKNYKDKRKKELSGKLRYGTANQLWGGELGAQYFFDPKKNARLGFLVKSIVEQYNNQDPIAPIVNSFYTLLLNDNYLKLYKETAVEANYFSELINGFYCRGILKYAHRDPLQNHTDLLLRDDINKLFSINNVALGNLNDSLNPSNNAFTAEVNFLIRFRQKYYTWPDQKISIGSKYPKLNIGYKKAIALSALDADYDLISMSLYDDIKLGLLGKFSYRLKAGEFINHKKMYFNDFKHFMGNQTLINSNDVLGSFRLLPYYRYSADIWYLEAHFEQHFRGSLITKIPLLKKLPVQEVVGLHFLRNNRLASNYVELNFGLERIFKVLRFDYVLAYSGEKSLKSGYTFGLNLSF